MGSACSASQSDAARGVAARNADTEESLQIDDLRKWMEIEKIAAQEQRYDQRQEVASANTATPRPLAVVSSAQDDPATVMNLNLSGAKRPTGASVSLSDAFNDDDDGRDSGSGSVSSMILSDVNDGSGRRASDIGQFMMGGRRRSQAAIHRRHRSSSSSRRASASPSRLQQQEAPSPSELNIAEPKPAPQISLMSVNDEEMQKILEMSRSMISNRSLSESNSITASRSNMMEESRDVDNCHTHNKRFSAK